MKKLTILLLLALSSLVSCQTKKGLYLLFEKKEDIMYIKPYSILDNFDVFIYKIKKTNKTGNYNKEIFFDSAVLKRDKPKLYQKTNSLEQLKKYDVKNYKWLEKKINSLKPFQELDQFYDRIYIIQINPINKKAIITEVDNIEIIE